LNHVENDYDENEMGIGYISPIDEKIETTNIQISFPKKIDTSNKYYNIKYIKNE